MALAPEQIDLLLLLAPAAQVPRTGTAAADSAPPALAMRLRAPSPNDPPPPAAPPAPGHPAAAPAEVLQLPAALGPAQVFPLAEGQRPIRVQKRADGRPVMTMPPPPITEVTFSGGGGKGAALPGAVRAMQEAHVFDQVRKVAGASVGSMTAAMLAAGMNADEFEQVANDPRTSAAIMEGHSTTAIKAGTALGLLRKDDAPLTGEGLQALVRARMDEALRKRLTEYLAAHQPPAAAADPQVFSVLERLSSDDQGPTFLDLRRLSAIIPAIKELVVTGTFVEVTAGGEELPLRAGGDKPPPKLYVFDADSEPQLPVAQAVQASAAFPGAFKPVILTLASGVTAKFIDGGVLNNTPTESTLGRDRKLDPVPQSRAMTFVFDDGEGAVDQLLQGKVKPEVGKTAQIMDWLVGAPNAAGDYATARDLAEHPEQLVKVPLKFTASIAGKQRALDYTGTAGGTLNFDMPLPEKQVLQAQTREATTAQIRQQDADRSQTFASDDAMFMAVPLPELQALVHGAYPQADQALAFRSQVAAALQRLQPIQDTLQSLPLERAAAALDAVSDELDALQRASHGAPEWQDYVARELNRGALDGLVGDLGELLRKGAADTLQVQRLRDNPLCQAALATRAQVELRQRVRTLETELIYPYLKKQTEGGTGLQTLVTMDERLRAATTAAQFNQALELGIRHFAHKRDLPPRTGHAAFAEALRQQLLGTS